MEGKSSITVCKGGGVLQPPEGKAEEGTESRALWMDMVTTGHHEQCLASGSKGRSSSALRKVTGEAKSGLLGRQAQSWQHQRGRDAASDRAQPQRIDRKTSHEWHKARRLCGEFYFVSVSASVGRASAGDTHLRILWEESALHRPTAPNTSLNRPRA